jgi:hypothetical protein
MRGHGAMKGTDMDPMSMRMTRFRTRLSVLPGASRLQV